MREAYSGKYIELDFSQNLALWPQDEVQSANFSGKQFTLHCSIVDLVHTQYHLSSGTTHDPVLVYHVLRDIIIKYDIRNQDLWIQSDNHNRPTQYKYKNAFFLLEKLAKEFYLRIIHTYGAAGHGKGAIDGMSSFGAKNVL